MFEALEEFDRKVAGEVKKAFPEFMEFSAVEESSGERALVITIDPPSHNVSYPLRIDTFGGEVTVSFEFWHSHFDSFSTNSGGDAESFVRRLLSGKCAVVSYWRDEQWCGTLVYEENEVPTDNEEFPYANRLHIRSWTGALDDDFSCTPRG